MFHLSVSLRSISSMDHINSDGQDRQRFCCHCRHINGIHMHYMCVHMLLLTPSVLVCVGCVCGCPCVCVCVYVCCVRFGLLSSVWRSVAVCGSGCVRVCLVMAKKNSICFSTPN